MRMSMIASVRTDSFQVCRNFASKHLVIYFIELCTLSKCSFKVTVHLFCHPWLLPGLGIQQMRLWNTKYYLVCEHLCQQCFIHSGISPVRAECIRLLFCFDREPPGYVKIKCHKPCFLFSLSVKTMTKTQSLVTSLSSGGLWELFLLLLNSHRHSLTMWHT